MQNDTGSPVSRPPNPPLDGEKSANPTPSPDIRALAQQFSETKEYFASYVSTQWERAQISLKETSAEVVLGGLTLFLFYGLMLIACAFVCYGAAVGLGEVLGRSWLGFIAVGGGFLVLSFTFLLFYLSKTKKQSLNKRVKDYEQELQKQNDEFGRNVLSQAVHPSQK